MEYQRKARMQFPYRFEYSTPLEQTVIEVPDTSFFPHAYSVWVNGRRCACVQVTMSKDQVIISLERSTQWLDEWPLRYICDWIVSVRKYHSSNCYTYVYRQPLIAIRCRPHHVKWMIDALHMLGFSQTPNVRFAFRPVFLLKANPPAPPSDSMQLMKDIAFL